MKLRVESAEFFVADLRTRLPFRFGITTMTWAPQLTVRVRVATEAGEAVGHAADFLAPKWFRKDPSRSFADDAHELIASAREAAAAFTSIDPAEAPLFELWHRVYTDRVLSQPDDAPDLLVRGFGVALLERAAMDAVCRAADLSFFAALKEDLFEFRPGTIHPELGGWNAAEHLPEQPLESIEARHTIGLTDPLRATDVGPGERVEDGLPQTLEECIERYGLKCFKLKLCGDPERDLARVLAFSELLAGKVPGGARITVDGNEQFPHPEALGSLFARLREHEAGRRFLGALLLVEQPLPRAISLDPSHRDAITALSETAPVLIDEADVSVHAFPRAIDCGYHGVSVKNCKGVFRALLNRALCDVRGPPYFQSGEDLTNIAVLALQQDLTTMAALGIPHVERNGHHYFHGLAHLPPTEAAHALERHPDLYVAGPAGPALRVEDGRLAIGSLQCPGYGHDVRIQVEDRTPLEQWRFVEPS